MNLRKIKDEAELRSLEPRSAIYHRGTYAAFKIAEVAKEHVIFATGETLLVRPINEMLECYLVEAPEPKRVRLCEFLDGKCGAIRILEGEHRQSPRMESKNFSGMYRGDDVVKIPNGRQFDLICHEDKAWEIEAIRGENNV